MKKARVKNEAVTPAKDPSKTLLSNLKNYGNPYKNLNILSALIAFHFLCLFFYYMKISNEDRHVFLQHKIWSCSKKTGTTLSMSRTIPMDLHVVGSFVIDVELGKTKTHFLLVRLIELGLNRQQPTSFTKVRES